MGGEFIGVTLANSNFECLQKKPPSADMFLLDYDVKNLNRSHFGFLYCNLVRHCTGLSYTCVNTFILQVTSKTDVHAFL